MKKLLSVLLSVCIIFTCCIPSFALENKSSCDCENLPVIMVCGVGALPFYMDAGTENERIYFPPTVNVGKIVFEAVGSIFLSIFLKDITVLSDKVTEIALDILGEFGCDRNGNPAYNVTHVSYDKSMAHHPELYENPEVSEFSVIKTAVGLVGADHVYCYNYDWRTDPVKNADDMYKFIENVLLETGHDKVKLAACSMGGLQTLTYFNEYGSDLVDTALFLSSAHNGLLFVGNLFAGDFILDQHDLFSWLKTFKTGNERSDAFLGKLFDFLANTKLLAIPFRLLNRLGKALNDQAVNKVLSRTFATMPGMWAFVRDDSYETAKQLLLSDASEAFIAKTDYFHYSIRNKSADILKAAEANGTKLAFMSHYDKGVIPITSDAGVHGDNLIETVCTSGGATVADFGETLGNGYKQAKDCDGHSHLSADGIIDASTCDFPDYTWFLKGIGHVGFINGSKQHDLLSWLLTFDGQPTVFDNPSYPQFLQSDVSGMTLTPIQ